MSAGSYQAGAGVHRRGRVGHVLEHLHAGDDVEARRAGLGQGLGGGLLVVHRHAGFQRVELCDRKRGFAHVDPGHGRATGRHALREDPAAASHVQHGFVCEPGVLVDIVQPQRIDVMKRLELAARIPPAVGELLELGDLGLIDVVLAAFHGISSAHAPRTRHVAGWLHVGYPRS